MKKAFFIILSCFLVLLTACKEKPVTNNDVVDLEQSEEEIIEETTDDRSEEDFKERYDSMMVNIELLNLYSEYCGTVHSTIWENVGADKVVRYINYVGNYGKNSSIDIVLILDAFDGSPFSGADKQKADKICLQYQEYMDNILTTREELENQYRELNSLYGNDHNISDLKEYYIESDTYADYATNVDGNLKTYNETLNDYKINLEKLKKAAELAY